MPSYLLSGYNGSSGVGGSIDCCTAVFFDKLATKLLDMSKSINERIEKIKNTVCIQQPPGVMLAKAELKSQTVGVKYEYIEYIKRYGPPENGKFDEKKLNIIRTELGIPTTNELDSDSD